MALKKSAMAYNINAVLRSISCSVCMDIVTKPYSLECIHSFCQSCIAGLPRDRQQSQTIICCPLCSNTTYEKDIKHNVTMQTLAEWYEEHSHIFGNLLDTGAVTDSVCSSCKKPNTSDHFCQTCKCTLCQNCKSNHEDVHVIQDITSILKTVPGINLPYYCKAHPSQEVTHNCNNCEEIICQDCHNIDHKDHYTEEINAALTRSMPMICEYLDKIDENMQNLRNAISNVNKQWHNAKNNREKIRKTVLAEQAMKIKKINEDTEEILKQLSSQDQLEMKEITTIQKDLQHNFSCQESLYLWCESIMQITKGPGLFNELNNELFTKIEAYANEPLNLEVGSFDIPEFTFEPSKIDTLNLVGTLDTKNDIMSEEEMKQASSQVRKISVFNENITAKPKRRSSSFVEHRRRPSLLAHIRRASLYEQKPGRTRLPRQQYMYRSANIHLDLLHSHAIDEEEGFKLDKLSQRICFVAGKFWLPCFEEKDSCIDVYRDGELINSFKFDKISSPHSLYPLNGNKIAVAADNGLFVINNEGILLFQILQGQFTEVCADENYIIALEKVSDKVQNIHVLHNNHSVSKRCSFTLTEENADTILLHRNRIYISLYQEDKTSKLVKYSVTGEKLTESGEYGRVEDGYLNFPRICAADINGSVLVADCNNCRLQVIDSKGNWTVIKQAVGYPWDAFVGDDGYMYILCGLYKYGYIQKCKIC